MSRMRFNVEESLDNTGYRDRSLFLRAIGGILLLVGLFSAFLGPAEMYCFYLFSEGGRFHYEGFGFGSFMFGNIASQIIGYYLIAVVCIGLGYGHLALRRWARTLSLTLLWFWLVEGLPLTIIFLFVLFASKELSPAAALIAIVLLGLCYLVLPGLLIRFYRGRNVRLTFETRDPGHHWIEAVPMPNLVLFALFSFYAVALHVPIFFNGLFPLFGVWLTGLQGILLLDVSIWALVFLAWGTMQRRAWAWWGSLVYFVLMSASWILTLARSSLSDILSRMNFAPTEMEILQGLPVQGIHLAVFVGVPLLITVGLIAASGRCFKAG